MKNNPSLIIAAGNSCFTRCKGCYQYFTKELIPTDDLLKFVKSYYDFFKIKKITLAGGDPLTRRDIVTLVELLYDMGLKIHMDTVGLPFIKKCDVMLNGKGIIDYLPPKLLKGKISKIGIPLDGDSTELINYFRDKISFDELKSILNVLNYNEFNICINTVLHKNNLDILQHIYDFISQYEKISQWQIFQYSPIGELGYRNRKAFEISEEDFKMKIKKLIDDNYSSKIKIEGKSNSYRKLNYVLVNSNGEVWQPFYDINERDFSQFDANSDKTIIGTIYDNDIIKKIDEHLKKIINIGWDDEKSQSILISN